MPGLVAGIGDSDIHVVFTGWQDTLNGKRALAVHRHRLAINGQRIIGGYITAMYAHPAAGQRYGLAHQAALAIAIQGFIQTGAFTNTAAGAIYYAGIAHIQAGSSGFIKPTIRIEHP